MFYDLNVPWQPDNPAGMSQTLFFLAELGYNVVALNHTVSGKLPAEPICAIPHPLPFPIPSSLRILTRLTLLSSPSSLSQHHRLPSLSSHYDLLALRPDPSLSSSSSPTDAERTLQKALESPDADILSIDLTARYPFHFQISTLTAAVKRGLRIELCYAGAVLSASSSISAGGAAADAARRNTIANATALIRATRGGRGLILSSECHAGMAGCRAPWDAMNLAVVWGLAAERAREAVSKEARGVVVGAGLKRRGYRGVVDVVYGGEVPRMAAESKGDRKKKEKEKATNKGQVKRKQDEADVDVDGEGSASSVAKSKKGKMKAGEGSGHRSGNAGLQTSAVGGSGTATDTVAQ